MAEQILDGGSTSQIGIRDGMSAKSQRNSAPRRTQQERRVEATDALLAAAAELFAERGVAETSLADIGARAGRSRGLASHHFGSKAMLVAELVLRCQRSFMTKFLSTTSKTGLDTVLHFVDVYLESFVDPEPERRAFVVLWGSTFPRRSAIPALIQADERARVVIAGCITQGREDGSIAPETDGDAAAVAILALLRGVAAQVVTGPKTIDVAKVRTQCRQLLTDGLRAKAPR